MKTTIYIKVSEITDFKLAVVEKSLSKQAPIPVIQIELELPSDEEIETMQHEFENSKQPRHFMTDENKSWHYTGFIDCAKYMRDLIQQQITIANLK